MPALGRDVLASADRHGSVSALDAGEGSGVVVSDGGVVPGVVSQGAGGFFQGSVASEEGDSPVSVKSVGSVCMCATSHPLRKCHRAGSVTVTLLLRTTCMRS